MFMISKNTTARAVLRFNKEKQLYKIIIAFNVTERNAQGKFKFPVLSKCDFVSGDINYDTLEEDLSRNLALAEKTLRTKNILFVD